MTKEHSTDGTNNEGDLGESSKMSCDKHVQVKILKFATLGPSSAIIRHHPMIALSMLATVSCVDSQALAAWCI